MKTIRCTAAGLIVLFFAAQVLGITTVPVKVVCPVCGATNDFYDYASWGSYIYQYKSKYQLVFFPHTWGTSIYLCKRCHFSLFLWDWKEFPKNRVEDAKKILAGVTVSKTFKSYTEISPAEKLQIAEKMYRLLGKDDDFWAMFDRVLAYHLDNDGKTAEAAQARRQALQLEEKFLADPSRQGERKETLALCGILSHFLGDDAVASQRFAEASTLKYTKGENASGYDAYLTELIKDYRQRMKDGTIPKDYREE